MTCCCVLAVHSFAYFVPSHVCFTTLASNYDRQLIKLLSSFSSFPLFFYMSFYLYIRAVTHVVFMSCVPLSLLFLTLLASASGVPLLILNPIFGSLPAISFPIALAFVCVSPWHWIIKEIIARNRRWA